MKQIARKGDYIIVDKENSSGGTTKAVFWIFFGIVGFIAIYMPFYGTNLRYQVGGAFSNTFNTIGVILFTLGTLMMLWGLLILFCGKNLSGIKLMLLGFLICYIGGFFLAPATLGSSSSGKDIPQGYH